MLKIKELDEILGYIKKGATMDMIAWKYGISTRTLSRKLEPYKKEISMAREYYKTVVMNIFN